MTRWKILLTETRKKQENNWQQNILANADTRHKLESTRFQDNVTNKAEGFDPELLVRLDCQLKPRTSHKLACNYTSLSQKSVRWLQNNKQSIGMWRSQRLLGPASCTRRSGSEICCTSKPLARLFVTLSVVVQGEHLDFFLLVCCFRALPTDYFPFPCQLKNERIAAIQKELASGKYDVVLLQEVNLLKRQPFCTFDLRTSFPLLTSLWEWTVKWFMTGKV